MSGNIVTVGKVSTVRVSIRLGARECRDYLDKRANNLLCPHRGIKKEREMEEKTKEPDAMLEMCVEQGYVPTDCYLTGVVVYHLVKTGEDPCAGCNLDRTKCKGRPRA